MKSPFYSIIKPGYLQPVDWIDMAFIFIFALRNSRKGHPAMFLVAMAAEPAPELTIHNVRRSRPASGNPLFIYFIRANFWLPRR